MFQKQNFDYYDILLNAFRKSLAVCNEEEKYVI